MELGEVRKFGAALPGVTEEPHHQMMSLRVSGKIFLTWPPDGSRVHLFVTETRARELATARPDACALLYWGAKVCGLRVELPVQDRAAVEGWIEEAWATKAPKRLVSARKA